MSRDEIIERIKRGPVSVYTEPTTPEKEGRVVFKKHELGSLGEALREAAAKTS